MHKWGVASSVTCECGLEEQQIMCNFDVHFIVLHVEHVACESQTTKPLAGYLKHARTSSLISPFLLWGGKRITHRL